jgi:hypothetical protein
VGIAGRRMKKRGEETAWKKILLICAQKRFKGNTMLERQQVTMTN